jgi:hypothetical protein
LGAAGRIGSDSLGVAVENTGANKLDQFLAITSTMSLHPDGSDTAVRIAVHVVNGTPSGLPKYVEGPNDPNLGLVAREYAGLVAFTLPGSAVDPAAPGSGELPAAGRDGPTTVLAVPVRIRAGGSADVVVTFRLPGRHGRVVLEPSARLPATQWRVSGTAFTDGSAHSIRW